MIVLFTDFGSVDPYIGQVKNVLAQQAPSVTVVDLLNHAPKFNPVASAYLLAAYVKEFSPGTVFLAIVDPGVGSSSRRALVLKVDDRWLVGPDNGLFNMLMLQAENNNTINCWEIDWQPEELSNTFHGRDIFAPIAAKIALGKKIPGHIIHVDTVIDSGWPKDLCSIIYIDHFGNSITGIQASTLSTNTILRVNNKPIRYARTYSEVEPGKAFWYENANGLIEFAVNQGSASQYFDLNIGTEIKLPQTT